MTESMTRSEPHVSLLKTKLKAERATNNNRRQLLLGPGGGGNPAFGDAHEFQPGKDSQQNIDNILLSYPFVQLL